MIEKFPEANMCGRYVLFTDEEDDDITDLVNEIQQRLYGDQTIDEESYESEKNYLRTNGEVFPSQLAPVITSEGPAAFNWGLPGFKGKGLIINAKSETVFEKPFFRPAIMSRRVVVPSHGFFEWQKNGKEKLKLRFNLPETKALFMAGLYNEYKEGPRFAIITTAANVSMSPVHDRMPVILRGAEAEAYLYDDGFAKEILSRIPPELINSAA